MPLFSVPWLSQLDPKALKFNNSFKPNERIKKAIHLEVKFQLWVENKPGLLVAAPCRIKVTVSYMKLVELLPVI